MQHFDPQEVQMRPTEYLPLQNFQAIDMPLGCSPEPEARCGKASGAINLYWLVLATLSSNGDVEEALFFFAYHLSSIFHEPGKGFATLSTRRDTFLIFFAK